jgi:hypothetical protein
VWPRGRQVCARAWRLLGEACTHDRLCSGLGSVLSVVAAWPAERAM